MSSPSDSQQIAVEPICWRTDALVAAVESAGAAVVDIADASALIWTDQSQAELFPSMVHDGIDWVQLPFAGIGPFVPWLDNHRTWTCGKGVYAPPVAEAALAMLLAGFRNIANYARANTWSGPVGQNLTGANVVVLGAGGITNEFLALLQPFDCATTVVRRTARLHPLADRTVALEDLHTVLPQADAVVLALALTPQTREVIGAAELALMKQSAWIVNVARGAHIDTAALVAALENDQIGGAALDVTEPEPLPDDHALWKLDNCLITPHVGNTPEMGLELLSNRVKENVARWLRSDELLGLVDVDAGY